MSAMIPEIRPVFQYGLLASSVSRIIAIYDNQEKYELTAENIDLVERAAKYLDDILNSQQLVSGVKGQIAPSGYGLKAWKLAMNTLPSFPLEAVNSSQKRTDLFRKIKSVLEDMINKTKLDVNKDELKLAIKFFGVVANQYLKEAEHRFRVESTTSPL